MKPETPTPYGLSSILVRKSHNRENLKAWIKAVHEGRMFRFTATPFDKRKKIIQASQVFDIALALLELDWDVVEQALVGVRAILVTTDSRWG